VTSGTVAADAARRPGSPDPSAWDAFVTSTPAGSYLQLSAWARVKAANGWSAVRILADGPDGRIGAQVLLRRPRPIPWAFAYAPRGPATTSWTGPALAAFTEELRATLPARAGRVSHVRVDPEVEAGGSDDVDGTTVAAFRRSGWRPAPAIQPATTRVIDLRADEDALWADLRKKWRQYVNRARSAGVRVVDAEGDRLGDFHAIYRETAARAGFHVRTEASYRAVWDAFRPDGRARLLFAETTDGTPVATLFLVRCGDRVVEPYGGMTDAGAESRANYLLKWEAIRRSREAGAAVYDLWGLAHPGIAHFKTGFGGREVAYIGAWDLVLSPVGRRAFGAAVDIRAWIARRQLRRHGRGPIADGGADT
jgi:lipid II:glycine glycyltransferase (peptidoglycan interpeptide bridge formation enzyme)